MKHVIALILCFSLIFTGCVPLTQSTSTTNIQTTIAESRSEIEKQLSKLTLEEQEALLFPTEYQNLEDPELLAHIKDLVYQDVVASLDSEKYFVENVSVRYISKEYLDEVAFNSQSNLFFGHTLDELNQMFEGTRYVFTLGDNGETTVTELEEIKDTTTGTIIQNIAIGTGVILVCVTVATVTGGTAAPLASPAISMIFMASAKTASIMAVSSAAFGVTSAGIVRGIQTGDIGEALKAAALSGSEEFMWGAISGALIGGASTANNLRKGMKTGLTMNEVALIQKESKLPIEVIGQIHSKAEYEVYKKSGLYTKMINGKTAIIQDIDLNFVSKLADGTEVTNLERMRRGFAPLDEAGEAFELHHIGQKADATLAVLTKKAHKDNYKILHPYKISEINRPEFAKARKEFWKSFAEQIIK